MHLVQFHIKQFADTETTVVLENIEQISNNSTLINFTFTMPSSVSMNDQIVRLLQVVSAVASHKPQAINVALS